MSEKEWYGNKELFEMIRDLTEEIRSVKIEMHETRIIIKEYNELRRTLGNCEKRISKIETVNKTMRRAVSGWREWAALIIAMTMAGLSLYLTIKGV